MKASAHKMDSRIWKEESVVNGGVDLKAVEEDEGTARMKDLESMPPHLPPPSVVRWLNFSLSLLIWGVVECAEERNKNNLIKPTNTPGALYIQIG